ncbi:MAG: MOSC domain-containing protein [Myxococcota bacterium]
MSDEGRVFSIQISQGGVPKRPIGLCRVTAAGIEGDRQRDLRFHGGPDRAVCVYSADLIEQLRAEGHPIVPGSIGENLTLLGLDWTAMQPGARLHFQGGLELELTSFAAPCRKISGAFVGRTFSRVSEAKYPGMSRIYARVLTPATLVTGASLRLVRSAS